MNLFDIIKPILTSLPIKNLKKSENLYSEGEEAKYIYIVQSGIIGLFHLSEGGKETFLRVFGCHAILGHRTYFANETYHANAIALSNVVLRVISIHEFEKLYGENTDLLLAVTRIIAKDLKEAELRLSNLQDKSAHLRVTESLVYLKLKYPHQVWTRQQIAEYAFSTNETVTRTMTKLEQMNLIEKVGRDYKIFNPEKLLNLSNDDF